MTDKPITAAEENKFYGEEASEYDIAQAIGAASTLFEDEYLEDVPFLEQDEFRKQWIADTASKSIFGRVGVIKSNEVKL